MKEVYNYQYDIDVKLECECCDNTYIRQDVYKTHDRLTKEDISNMYENLYEGEPDDEMPHCDKCDSFMFETEIINLNETILNPKKEVDNEIE